tara:strand:- start:14 stop:787 length:774 start_codon:yes stop_codon:yes gene_type:complete
MYLIILAAGKGSRLHPLTESIPKCMVNVLREPILSRIISSSMKANINKIVAVCGYKHEKINNENVIKIINHEFYNSNMLRSLMCANEYFQKGFIMSYGDIIYSHKILEKLRDSQEDITVVIDIKWFDLWKSRFENPLSDAETLKLDKNNYITEIGKKTNDLGEIEGQYVGLIYFRGEGVKKLKLYYDLAKKDHKKSKKPFGSSRTFPEFYMTDLLQGMIQSGEKVKALTINGGWSEIDSHKDLEITENLIKEGKILE